MNCMKCGQEIGDSQVFCDKCLSVMKRYPVKPDVHIQLPSHSQEVKHPSRKVPPTPEEQIQRLQRRIKRLWIALVCAALALITTVTLLLHIQPPPEQEDNTGKNYSTADTR